MLIHDMGADLMSSIGYYNMIVPQPAVRNDKFAVSEQPTPGEWRTAPLWGVADSGPYLHDGRAVTLEAAIETARRRGRRRGRPVQRLPLPRTANGSSPS